LLIGGMLNASIMKRSYELYVYRVIEEIIKSEMWI
jgi:hypothetical protein